MRATLILALALAALVAVPAASAAEHPALIVACAVDAPAPVRASAERVRAAAATQPLLQVCADGKPPAALADARALAVGRRETLAFAHVVVVGLADDPLVVQAWQHEAEISPQGLYAFGFGALAGDLGWVEAGPNPWLHSPTVGRLPYEAQAVVITGTTPVGLDLAVTAFIDDGLVNGVVAKQGWKRTSTTVLDQDPSDGAPHLPAWLAARAGDWTRIALTQCGADVARGVLADSGSEPQACWLVKYHHAGGWDEAGAPAARRMYLAGLHRRAYGDAVLLARFATPEAARAAAAAVAKADKLHEEHGRWSGRLAALDGDASAPGPLEVWAQDGWLVMSSLPEGVSAKFGR
jgi:hypothetical protein